VRYVIYGAGAIGGTIGGRLFEHGHDVTLIARGEHRRVLAADGLTLASPDRTVQLAIPTAEHPSDVELDDGTVVILAMKTQDTAAALLALAACAPARTTIVCAQNGVENERLALRHFRDVIAMCVMLPAEHLEPGVVVAWSAPTAGILDVGCYPQGTTDAVEQISSDLRASGFDSRADPAVMRAKHAKLLMNLGNSLEAACGPHERGSGLYQRAKEEALACFLAAGIDAASDEEDATRRGTTLQLQPIEGHERQGGSSWQSLARGTGAIEADYLNGEIVLLGRLHGVRTPVNEALQHAANRMARERRAPGSLTIEELLGPDGTHA
jgi:2-dehydropantoate 2-reductase